MDKRRTLVIVGLALVALAAAAYLVYSFTGPAQDRPTLMYFRADL